MKKLIFTFTLLLVQASNIDAAEVKLESLEAFDINAHKICVNIHG